VFGNRVWAIEFSGKLVVRGAGEGCLAVSLSSEEYPIADDENIMTSSNVRCLGHVLLRQRQICLQLVQYLRSLFEGGFQIGF